MRKSNGLKEGLAIGLGYFAVAFAFGIFTTENGISPLVAGLISFTNLSSTGQFAGVNLMLRGASYLELALTVLLINLRYFLMSMSLSQKLEPNLPVWKRLLIAQGVTDEIFAVGLTRQTVNFKFYLTLMVLPIVGWTTGTLVGAYLGEILPPSISSALGIALYTMFIAIVLPVVRRDRAVAAVSALAAVLSLIFAYVPVLKTMQLGWKIIICTVIASGFGASLAPLPGLERPADSDDINQMTATRATSVERKDE